MLTRMATPTWRTVKLAPVVLLMGSEEYFSARAVDRLKKAHAAIPDAETVTLDSTSYSPGQLSVHTSPSLFSASRLIIATDCHKATDDFYTDVKAYLGAVAPDVTVVLVHGGGNRGRSVITAIKKHADAVTIDCAPIKKDSDKAGFVAAECRSLKRQIAEGAIAALLAAHGGSLRELAAACHQLHADIPVGQTLTAAHVDQYYGGRVEATGFKVADAVVARNTSEALRLLRHSVNSGVNPVPIVAALAARFRTIITAGSAPGSGAAAAKEVGMAPWQFNNARRDARHWSSDALGVAMVELADADELVKGGSKDPVYAVERAVLRITTSGR